MLFLALVHVCAAVRQEATAIEEPVDARSFSQLSADPLAFSPPLNQEEQAILDQYLMNMFRSFTNDQGEICFAVVKDNGMGRCLKSVRTPHLDRKKACAKLFKGPQKDAVPTPVARSGRVKAAH